MNEEKTRIASPDGALSFLFAVFALLTWFSEVYPLENSSLFSIGTMQIILSVGALAASFINLIRGKPRSNLNLMITFLLGFFPGIRTLMVLLAQHAGVDFSFQIFGLMYLVGSVFCFGVSWQRLDKHFYRFAGTLFLGVGLMMAGFGDLLKMELLTRIGGWFLLIFALEMFYYGLSIMYGEFGESLPQGRSLKQILEGRNL